MSFKSNLGAAFRNRKKTKVCSKCKTRKLIKYFRKETKSKWGVQGYCKFCQNENDRKYRKKNKDKVFKVSKNTRLIKTYGVSLLDYEKLYKQQAGSCAICNEKFDILYIDHCHNTNKTRGLLCIKCNFGIGHFKDSISILKSAIVYLGGDL